MDYLMKEGVLGSLTARCIKVRLRPRVLSKNQSGMATRTGSVWPIVAARGRNSAATVGASAMVPVEDELWFFRNIWWDCFGTHY